MNAGGEYQSAKPGTNNLTMHILGIMATICVGIYTLAWAQILYGEGNKAGAAWTVALAIVSTATSLYYFWTHGFLP